MILIKLNTFLELACKTPGINFQMGIYLKLHKKRHSEVSEWRYTLIVERKTILTDPLRVRASKWHFEERYNIFLLRRLLRMPHLIRRRQDPLLLPAREYI